MFSRFICVKPYGTSVIKNSPLREGTLARGSVSKEQIFPSINSFLEQRPVSSLFSLRKYRHTASTKIPCPSTRQVSHLGRRSSYFLSFPHVLTNNSLPASRTDLFRADPLKAQDVYSLERSSRVGERSWIEGAVPAGRIEGKDATPEPVLIEEEFAGEEPEPVARDFRDRLVEQDTIGWHEHQVKIDQFQAFISGLSMVVERFRVLDLPEEDNHNLECCRAIPGEPRTRRTV